MVFSSLLFLFLFLPAVLAVYSLSPWRIKNLVLLACSLVFYAWGEPIYIVIILISTVADYFFGILLSQSRFTAVQKKWIVVSSIIVNLGLLSYFKYADFLIHNVNELLGTHIPLTELPLPIGISFYTFQSLSYIIDVYRGQVKAQRNWIDFATYVALFPQLVAGPIVKYSTIAEQLRSRTVSIELFAQGVRRFIIGLAKKVLLANNIGLLWHTISSTGLDTMPAVTAWIGIIAFALQIYFDFSGYSDMAIGLGMMFGFRFNENFNRPYTAQSITDFWRRWHISLGSWFREYVYIPLGGNRRGLLMQLRNILIVWALTGIWHGASWNFVLWGLYFGLLLIIEKWWGLRLLNRLPRWMRHLYALLAILGGWVLFAFEEIREVAAYFQAMMGLNEAPLWDDTTLYYLYTHAVLLIVLIIAAAPPSKLGTLSIRAKGGMPPMMYTVIPLLGYGLLFFLSISYLVDATYNPFLYFRF